MQVLFKDLPLIFFLVFLLTSSIVFASDWQYSPSGFDIYIYSNHSQWNRSSNLLYPYFAGDSLKIPSLANCDTIDTDADGLMSCGSDGGASGAFSNFQLANVSNNTPFANILNMPAYSNFQLSNVSNNTLTKGDNTSITSYIDLLNVTQHNWIIAQGYASGSSFSNFQLSNVSNKTPFHQIINMPAYSNFQLANVSNNTLTKGDNASITSYINLLNATQQAWVEAQGYSSSTAFSNFRLENVSNNTPWSNVLDKPAFSNFQLSNVSNKTPFHQIINMPAYSNFQLANVSNNTLTKGDNASITSYIDLLNATQQAWVEAQGYASGSSFSNFKLENVSNNTPWANVLDKPLFSNFRLENVSNDTLHLGDNLSITAYIDLLNATQQAWVEAQGYASSDSFSNFRLENVSNNTPFANILDMPAYSNFQLSNVSNNTLKLGDNTSITSYIDLLNSTQQAWVEAQGYLTSTPDYSNFQLANVSNNTPWANVLDKPAFSNFQLANVSNNTLKLGDNVSITSYINLLNSTQQAWVEAQGYLTSTPDYSNFKLENVSNVTPFSQITGMPAYSNFQLSNVSNKTPFAQILNMPAYSNFQLSNVSNNTLTIGDNDSITSYIDLLNSTQHAWIVAQNYGSGLGVWYSDGSYVSVNESKTDSTTNVNISGNLSLGYGDAPILDIFTNTTSAILNSSRNISLLSLGNITLGKGVIIQGLYNCDTIDTNALGQLVCGSDDDSTTFSNFQYSNVSTWLGVPNASILKTSNISIIKTDLLTNRTPINATNMSVDTLEMKTGNKFCFNGNCSVYQCLNNSNGVWMFVNEDSTQVCT